LTQWRRWSLPALRKQWNQVKDVVAPWWADNSKEAYNTGLANAAAAFDNYRASCHGTRAGAKVGKPRLKRRHATGLSCRFTTGSIRVEPDRKHVTLPRLGTIKTHEATRKLARRLEQGNARVLSATVSQRGMRWFVAFQVAVRRTERPAVRPDVAIGVDLGISHLAVLSTPVLGVSDSNGFVANPRHLERALKKLRRVSRAISRRQGPSHRAKQPPSNRWRHADKARRRLCRQVANARRDGLHKLTIALAEYAGTIVVEDLNVNGMLRNKRLAVQVSDAGWAPCVACWSTRQAGGAGGCTLPTGGSHPRRRVLPAVW
jgi:putative transposase